MKNIIKIYQIVIKNWGLLLLGLLTMFIFSALSSANIAFVKPLFDTVFNKTSTPNITTFAGLQTAMATKTSIFFNSISITNLIFSPSNLKALFSSFNQVFAQTSSIILLQAISAFLVIIFFLKNLFLVANKFLFFKIHASVIKTLRKNLFNKYLNLSLSFFTKNSLGDSMVRIRQDVDITTDFIVTGILNSIQQIITIIIFAKIAATINFSLFMQGIILVPAVAIAMSFLGKKIKKYAKRLQNQTSNVFSHVEEVFSNIKIVKAYSKENYENKIFSKINTKFIKFWQKASIYNSFSVPIGEFNSIIIGILVIYIGGVQVLNPAINFTFGDFMSFLIAIFSIQHPLKVIVKQYVQLKKATVSANRIFEILDINNSIQEDKNSIELKSFESKIEFKNVCFKYPNSTNYALSNINLVITKNEKVAFTGLSGCGKTTLLALLNRMHDPTSGEIFIDGINIKRYSLKSLRKNFGVVNQESFLFGGTILENISYSNFNLPLNNIIQASKTANAYEFIIKLDNKFNFVLKPKAANLSGGQKQRICIARAIVLNPDVLLFDEATSALDTESEFKVQDAIDKATKNRTVCVVAHRLSTIINSDKIVLLDSGKIKAIGTHPNLLKTNKLWQNLYNKQYANK